MQVNHFLTEAEGETHKPMSILEVALGFIDVANEAMCRPIRALTQVCDNFFCRIIVLNIQLLYLPLYIGVLIIS